MGMFKKLNAFLNRAEDAVGFNEQVVYTVSALMLVTVGSFFLGLMITPQDDLLAKLGLRGVQLFTALFTTLFLGCSAALCALAWAFCRQVNTKESVRGAAPSKSASAE